MFIVGFWWRGGCTKGTGEEREQHGNYFFGFGRCIRSPFGSSVNCYWKPPGRRRRDHQLREFPVGEGKPRQRPPLPGTLPCPGGLPAGGRPDPKGGLPPSAESMIDGSIDRLGKAATLPPRGCFLWRRARAEKPWGLTPGEVCPLPPGLCFGFWGPVGTSRLALSALSGASHSGPWPTGRGLSPRGLHHLGSSPRPGLGRRQGGPRARDPETPKRSGSRAGSRRPARPRWGPGRSLAPERRGQGWCRVSLPRPLWPCFLHF